MFKRITILLLCVSFICLKAEEPINDDSVLQGYIDSYHTAVTPDSLSWFLGAIVVHTSWTDLDLSKSYLKEFDQLMVDYSDPIVEIEYYNAKGVLYYSLGESLDSILYFFDITEEKLNQHNLKHTKLRIGLKNNRAIAYARVNLKEAAIKEYLAALEIVASSEIKMPKYETALYSNIASMLNTSERYEDALEYILKGEASNKQHEKSIGEHSNFYDWIILTKAVSLYNLGKVDEAESILLELQSFYKNTNVESNSAKTLLGQVYYKQGKVHLARKTLHEATLEAKKLNITVDNEAIARLRIAEMEYEEENYSSALENLEIIIELFPKDLKGFQESTQVYALMAKVLEKSKRFEEALKYLKNHQAILNKVREDEAKMKQGELKGHFSNIEKKYKINELEIKQKLQESKFSVLIVAFIFAILIILFTYIMYVRKSDHNKALLKVNEEIKQANIKVLSASKAKENFLSRISHEMRTPMNAVIGIANILLDENPTNKQKEYLNKQKFSGELLLDTINEVLIYSKINNNKVQVNRKPIHLQKFLDMTIDSYRIGSNKSTVRIYQDQKLQTLQDLVLSDKSLFGQVLMNLIGNAVKYTEEGHIILKTDILENNNLSVKILFEIEDTGIGIPADKMQSVLDSFSQVNNEITRTQDGTGLGLSIVQGLLDLKNSRLEVKSTPGVGSTFRFNLIFEKAGPIQKPSKARDNFTNLTQNGIEGKRILLVEDNKLNQLVAKKVLQKFKVEIALAENGQQALDMVQQERYDLILMDIHMPIMDGIEATRSIRALKDPFYQQIPIVALSADAYSERVQATTESGMNDYLAKPFKPEDLFQKLKSNLESADRVRGGMG